MAFPGYNVAATIPRLSHLVGRQSGGDGTSNSSNGEDKWAIGNDTDSSPDQYRWIFIVDQTILSLTVAGSLAILLTMFILERKGRPATTRMRLVQSLVLSDLILGIVGTVGTGITLDGGDLSDMKASCDGLGFTLVAVLWTEHLWTMALAIATYMILIYPLHQVTMWLERKWYWLWGIVWLFAIAVAMIGQFVYGYFDTGGLCYYGANAGLYGELIQFIPRTIVMLLISCLYLRLYVFLRRPDRIRASFSDTDNNNLYQSTHRSSVFGRSGRALTSLFSRRKSSQPAATGMATGNGDNTAKKQEAIYDAGEKAPGGPADGAETEQPGVPDIPIIATTAPLSDGPVEDSKHSNRPRRISLPPVDRNSSFYAPPEEQLSPRSISEVAPTSFPFDNSAASGTEDMPSFSTSSPANGSSSSPGQLGLPGGRGRGSMWTSTKRITPTTPNEELPPWEQIQLPVFHVDGERFGGASANASAGPSREGSGMWSSWKGLGGGRRAGRGSAGSAGAGPGPASVTGSPPILPVARGTGSARASISPIPTHSARMGSLDAAGLEVGFSPSLKSAPVGDADRIPGQQHLNAGVRERNASISTTGSKGGDPPRKASAVSFPTRELTPIPSNTSTLDESTASGTVQGEPRRTSNAAPWTPSGSRRSSAAERDRERSRQGSVDSSPRMTRKFSLPIEYVAESASASSSPARGEKTTSSPPRKGSLSRKRAGDLAMSNFGTKSVRLDDEIHFSPDGDVEGFASGRRGSHMTYRGGDAGADGPEKDFSGAYVYGQRHGENRDLDAHGRGRARDEVDERADVNHDDDEEDSDGEMDLMRMLQGDSNDSDGNRRNPEASYEFVEESMASYLNRKTALLMLWFPLGYVLLFSVSLVRIIYDFASRPPIVLRALSRWFVFAQGLLDAIIYGLVEWHTKRVVRKRVRKGTFNTPQTSRGRSSAIRAQGIANAASDLGSRALASMRVFSSGGPTSSSGRADVGTAESSATSSGTAKGSGSGSAPGDASRSRQSQLASQTQSQIGSILGPLERSRDKFDHGDEGLRGNRSGGRMSIPSFEPESRVTGSGRSSAGSGAATPTMPQGYEVGRHASVAPTMGSDGSGLERDRDTDPRDRQRGREREREGSEMTFASGAPLLHQHQSQSQSQSQSQPSFGFGNACGYGYGYGAGPGHRGSIAPSAAGSAMGSGSARGSGSGSGPGSGTESSRKGSDTSAMDDLGKVIR